jgi:hypothetical protein
MTGRRGFLRQRLASSSSGRSYSDSGSEEPLVKVILNCNFFSFSTFLGQDSSISVVDLYVVRS